ncbi:MAG TPA: sigma 54-interacting transcriptional regulator [Pirellulales bacterium]|jgi:transcriptional regulator with AAA-type ATPase domain|nr:sigma 54-interacting transcriptional regulator [Pirellulales bacterium]
MHLFTPPERRFAEAVSRLVYCNPFLPERIEHERAALQEEFDERNADWNLQGGISRRPPNVLVLIDKTEQVLERARDRLAASGGSAPADEELALYEDLLVLLLFDRHGFGEIQPSAALPKAAVLYEALLESAAPYLVIGTRKLPLWDQMPHMFACFFQLRNGFQNIFNYIIGVSHSAVELRAAVWQSIFTHDMRRYRRMLYKRMADYTTLITGPSGTGKELVARAIGLSRYIAFDPQARTFAGDSAESFFSLHLSALSPTLIESELFGHKRGSFTGAVADRAGWLEVCPPLGTVFLDEIGDLDPAIQVKLLRVLQSRTFSRLGETETRQFQGKILAAANQDLSEQIRNGRFREDLYYRLCSDIIVLPSLAQRLADDPDELRQLILHLVRRTVGEDAPDVSSEVENWIAEHLGMNYAWPGNIRELEQCVRNVLIRKQYHPPRARSQSTGVGPNQSLAADVLQGNLTVDELLRRYCTLVYAQTGSYEATARRLKLDRRTVKAKVDPRLLEQIA